MENTPLWMSDDFVPSISLIFKLTHNATVGQNSDLCPKPAGVPFCMWSFPLGGFGSGHRNKSLKKPLSLGKEWEKIWEKLHRVHGIESSSQAAASRRVCPCV